MSEILRNNKPLLIIVAGLVGGLGAWVWAKTVGPSPLLSDPVLAIPSYMFLGAIAGFLGVYLIAKTDPAQTGHAIAFSLACGVFWGPVISGAEAIVTKEKTQAIAQAVATQHDELKVTKAAIDAQANHLQASLAEVTRQAEAVERARQKLLDVTRSTSHLSPNVRTQLEQITTATIHRQLDRSSANLDTIQRELKATELAPLNSRIFTRDE